MRYYKELYLAPGLEKKKERIIEKLGKGTFQIGTHLIVLSQNGTNQLEILNSALLLQPDFPKEDPLVVGLTKSYEDALELVEKIVRDVYDKTRGADIRSYILEREQEG